MEVGDKKMEDEARDLIMKVMELHANARVGHCDLEHGCVDICLRKI